MTELSTVASIEARIDDSSVRDIESTLEDVGPIRPEIDGSHLQSQLDSVTLQPDRGAVADGGSFGFSDTLDGVYNLNEERNTTLESMVELGDERNEFLEDIYDTLDGGPGSGIGGLSGGPNGNGPNNGGGGSFFEKYLGFKFLEKGGNKIKNVGGAGLMSKLFKYGSALTVGAKTAVDLNEAREDLDEGNRPAAGEDVGEGITDMAFGTAGWLAGGPAGAVIGAMLGEPTYDKSAEVLRNTWDPETTAADAASGNPNRSFPGVESMSPTNPSPVNVASWMSGVNAPSTSDMTLGEDALNTSDIGEDVLNTSDVGGGTPARTDGVSMVGGYVPMEALSLDKRLQRTASKAQQTAESVQNMDVTVNVGGVDTQGSDPQQVKSEVLREIDGKLDRKLRQVLGGQYTAVISNAQQSNFQDKF